MKRTFLVALAAGAALVLPATSAFAHVTVNPREATQGGYAKLAFRVPNERDNAGTTKLEVNFPADHPFASVSVRPQAGWTYTVERIKLATPIKVHDNEISETVSKITWTGGEIKPNEFNEFEVSVGPLPSDVDSLTFKALQTYGNGEIVRWIEEAAPGGARGRAAGAGAEAEQGGDGDNRHHRTGAGVAGRRGRRVRGQGRRLEERRRHGPDVRDPGHGLRPARVRLGHGRPPAPSRRAVVVASERRVPAFPGGHPGSLGSAGSGAPAPTTAVSAGS